MTPIQLLSKISRRLPNNAEILAILTHWRKLEEEYLEQPGWVRVTAASPTRSRYPDKNERMFGAKYADAGMRKVLMDEEAQNTAAWNLSNDRDHWLAVPGIPGM